jgi:uncharacterized protein YceK
MSKLTVLLLLILFAGCSSISVREVDKADRTMTYKASKAQVLEALQSYCADEDWTIERSDATSGIVQTDWKYFSPEVTFRERKKFTAEITSVGQDTRVYLSMVDEMQDVKTSRWATNRMASSTAAKRYLDILEGIGSHLNK